VHWFDFVFVLGREAFFFFGRPAEEAAQVLWDGLSNSGDVAVIHIVFAAAAHLRQY
jgi:hypothetical protein